MDKMRKVMDEFKHGKLHSGSKKGPEVTSRKQAIAIGMSEARNAKSKALKKRVGDTKPEHGGYMGETGKVMPFKK